MRKTTIFTIHTRERQGAGEAKTLWGASQKIVTLQKKTLMASDL